MRVVFSLIVDDLLKYFLHASFGDMIACNNEKVACIMPWSVVWHAACGRPVCKAILRIGKCMLVIGSSMSHFTCTNVPECLGHF